MKKGIIEIRHDLKLCPFDFNLTLNPENYAYEKAQFFSNTLNSKVKRFLPEIHKKSAIESGEVFDRLLSNASDKKYIFYSISILKLDNWCSGGYIFLAHPDLESVINENGTPINGWAISFLLGKEFRGEKIMTLSISHFLKYLNSKFQINRIVGVVDNINSKSTTLLESLNFEIISDDKLTGKLVYGRIE